MDGWIVLLMAVFLEGWMGFGMDGLVSGLDGWILMNWIDEWMDGWMDGTMDGTMDVRLGFLKDGWMVREGG